jgi:hypothetical protein
MVVDDFLIYNDDERAFRYFVLHVQGNIDMSAYYMQYRLYARTCIMVVTVQIALVEKFWES